MSSIKSNLKIRVENQYGNLRNFPDCAASRELLKLTGRKTFLEADLKILQAAGFRIERSGEVAP